MSNGCREIFVRRAPRAGRAVVALWLVAHLAVTTPALALPQDGRITAGEGAIEQTSASSLLIEQRSQRMAADFTSFDIGAGEAVNILQPGRTAVFLGNITGESATTIFGTLTANGQVVLVNPRGVVFGENSRVDTASLIATSLGVDVDAFMDGAIELEFAAEVAGRIVNRGVLEAASGGSVTLLGDEVVNEGLIVAELGRVNLASGSRAVLTFDAEGLVGLEVTEAALGGLGGDAAVLNSGTIEANGGQILLAADAARDLFDRAVNNEGILRASGAREVNGEIVLTSTADTVSSGEILAVNEVGVGGRVDVLGDRVAVTAGTIDVSGSEGGGRVRIGGDFRGADTLPRAERSYVGPDARIAADARRDGDGGEVVVWGDTEIRYFGRTTARGGAEGGDGGFVELSTREGFEIGGEVDTSAPNGETGTLLVDPTDIFIVEGTGTLDGEVDPDGEVLFAEGGADTTISVGALQGLGDTNITLEAVDQITVGTEAGAAADVDLSASLTTATLTLRAGNGTGGAGDITFNGGSRIETGGGGLVLEAGQSGDTSGDVTLGEIVTAGGRLAIDALGDIVLEGPASVGDLVLAAGGSIRMAGGTLDAVGASPVGFDAPVVLLADLEITGASDIAFNDTVDGDGAGAAESLTLTAGGTIDFAAGAVVGGTDPLASLVIADSGGATFAEALTLAGALEIRDTAGTIEFRNVLTATSVSAGAAPFAVDFDAAPNVAGAGDFDNTGGLTFAAGGFFGGGLDVSSSATSAAGALTSTGDPIVLADLDLSADAALDSAGGAIDVEAVTSNGFALTLDGADTGSIDVATLAGDGALTIVDSAGTTFAGSVAASTVTLTDSSGTIAFQGDTTISTRLATASQPYAVSFTGASTSVAGATTFANAGTITLGDGGDALTFDAGVVATAPSAIDLNGTVAVNSGVITLGDGDTTLNVASTTTIGGSSTGGINLGLANLADGVTLTVGTGIANRITVAGVVGTADGGNTVEGLEIDTTEAVTVTGAIGAADGSNDLDQLEIVQSGGTTFEGTLDAGSVVLTDTSGIIAFEDVTRIGAALVTSGAAYDVAFTGAETRIAGTTDFLNTGSVRFGGDLSDSMVFVGGVNTRGNASNPALTILEGTLRTGLGAGQDVQLGSTRLVGPTTIVAGAGVVSATDVTDQDNGFGLTVQDAGATGAVSIGGFQLGALTTRGGAYDVSLLDSGTVTGDTNFLNTGTVVLGDQGDGTDTLRFLGGLATAGNPTNPSVTFVNAAIVSADTRMDLGAMTLAGATTLRSGDGAIAIASLAGSGRSLSLQTAGDAGTVTIAGAATIGALLTGASDFDIAFNDGAGSSTTTLEAATSFDNTGRVSFGDDTGDVTVVGGALSTAAALGGTELAGLLSTQAANGAMTLSASTLNADAVVASGSGAIDLAAVAGAGLDLTLQDATPGSTGAVTIAGPVTLGSLGTFAQAYDVSLLGGGTIAAATDFRNGGSLTLGDAAVDVLTFGAGLVTTNAAGPLELAGVLRTVDADMLLRAATLTAGTRLESGSGAIEIASLTDGAGAFTLQLQDSAAVGAVTIDGALTVNRLVTAAGAYDVSLLGGATVDLDTNFINLGTVTLGDDVGDSSVFLGGLATTAAGGTATAGRITTAGADLDLGATTLAAETTLESGGGSLNLGAVDSGGARLALDGAAGAVRVGSFLGQGDIEVVDSGGTTFTGPLRAGTVTLTDTVGTIEFAGDTSITTELVTSPTDYALAFTGVDNTIDGPAVTRFLNTGGVTIGDDAGDAAQFTQGVDTLSGPVATAVAGRITTGGAAAQAITLNATTLTANTTLIAGAGSVSIASVTEGGNGFGLTVQDPAATGAVSIGAFQLGALTTAGGAYDVSLLDAGSVSGDTNFLNTGIVTLGDEGAGVDVLNFDGGLDTTNNSVTDIAASVRTDGTQMDLGPVALTGDSTLRSGAGALNVASVAGAGRTLELQDALATGTVSVAGDLTVDSLVVSPGAYDVRLLGGATVTTPTSFLSTGTVTLGDEAGAVTTFVGGVDTTAAAGTVAAGTVATADAPMVLSPLTLTDSTTLVADSARITVASISGPGQTLGLQRPDATGPVAVEGEITVGRLDTSPGAYDVSLLGGGTVAASTTFLNTGVLTLGDAVGDELTFSGGLDSTAVAGGTRLAGEVSTDDAPLSLGATSVLVDATLESGAGALNVASIAGADRRLAVQSLTATGAVTFAGDVALGALDTFNGPYDVTFAGGGTIAADTTFRNRGVVTLGDGATDFIAFDGGLDTVGAEATRLDGTVVSIDADIDFGTTVLTGAASVRAGSGAIDFGSVSDGDAGLALAVQDAAATGAVRFLGAVGLGALETFAGAYDVALLGGGRVAADTTFLNTTQIVIGDDGGDATVFAGGLDTRSAATTSLAGMLGATDAQIDLGVTSLLGPTSVVAGAGAVNIATVAGGGQGLSLQDSASTGAVAILDRFDDLASLTSADGDFAITLQGGGEVAGATALRNRGLKVLGDDADDAFRFAGGLAAESGITRLLGSFTNIASDLDFGAMEIAGPTTLTTGDGTLRAGAVDGGGAALTIDAGDGEVLLGSFANGGPVTFTEAEVTTVAGDFAAASLTLEGGSSFTVGGGLDVGGAFFNAGASSVRIDGPATLGSLTSQASDGRIAFLGDATVDGELLIIDGAPAGTSGDVSALTVGGALRANSVTVGAPDVAVALEGDVDVAGVTRLQTSGGVRLGTAGELQVFRGGLSIAGPATTFASISVDSGPLELAAVTQAGATVFASGGQAISTGTIASRGFDLAIDAGNGDVLLGGVAGAGRLELRAADSVATGDLSAASLDIDEVSALTTEGVFELGAIDSADTSGSLLFRGAGAVTGEQATVFANAGGVVFERAPVPGRNVTFREGGSLDLAAGTFVFGGGLDTRATAVTLNGSRLVTESTPITAAGLNVVGPSALDTTLGLTPEAGAAITLDGLVTGDGASLDLFAGSGSVDVRQTVALGSFAVRSGESLTLDDVTTTGNSVRVVVSGDITLNGDITAQQGDVVIVSTGGTLRQLVGLIDPDVDESQSNGAGAIVRALNGDAILAAKDAMTVNLVEAPQGDILLALLGPAEAGVARGIVRGQSFGAISNEGSGSADLIAGGTVAVVAAEQAEFGDEDNGFLIAGDGQFITLDGGDSFIQESNASTLQTLDGGVAQDFDDAFDPLLDDPLRPLETQVDGAVFDALSAALRSRVSATARRTSSVADSEDALAQQADEEELLTNLSEDVFQDIRLVSQDQQPLCLPETLQGFDSIGCAAGAEQTAVRVDAAIRPLPERAAAGAPDAARARRASPGSPRLGPGSIGGAGGAD